MKRHQEVIPIDKPDLVKQVTLTVWDAGDKGLFLEEKPARYSKCTHDYCDECGTLTPCGYTVRLMQDAGSLKKGNKLGISHDEFQLFEVVR